VRRELIRSTAFLRKARRLLKRDPALIADLEATLVLLEADAFDPRLKTHKLTGSLEGLWACSAGYNLRLLFQFVQHEDAEAIRC
jgi:mRNA-degrading endonuclease YafQ of YafQ-DinJ toxin-antitoxin module